jgi:hypothetical protein
MRLPKTMDEYQEMVEQALAEVEDLRQSAEFDENDEWGGVYRFLDSIEAELRHLHQSMVNGSYSFGDSDLPYMRFIANVDPYYLPFKSLLEAINLTHQQGLSEDTE